MELTRENFRAMIYYDFRRGLLRQEGIDHAPCYAIITKRWYNEFNCDRHFLTDKFRKGRPKSVVGHENINTVQKTDNARSSCDIL